MIDRAAPTAPARVVRSSVFAVLCVLLSALGHGYTSGRASSPSTLALAVTFVAACAWLITGRQRGPMTIVCGLAAGQALLHLWFSIDPASGHAAHAAEDLRPTGPGAMLAAHVLAAVACGLWLWWGERTAFALVRALVAWVRPLLRLLLPGHGGDGVPVRTETTRAHGPQDPLRHCQVRRGPPSVLFRVPESALAS
ncbi:hypothetical protein [Nocardia sp. NPDC050710]|uniref:hypothetical protein n=1 Tax=Nocardia sp. NPDC050710 TaxID=3157220 RepID=UPI003410C025